MTRTPGRTAAARGVGSGRGLRSLVRAVSWHRRLVAAACVAIAVAAALQVVEPDDSVGQPVVVASGDLAAGQLVGPDDVRVVRAAPGTAPRAAVSSSADVVGRRVAAPLGAGEPVTERRLLGAGLLAAHRGQLGSDVVQTTVRVTDGATLALVSPGDRVDVVTAPLDSADPGAPRVVAAAAPVLVVPGAPATPDEADADGDGSGLIVLATTPSVALDLAGAAVGAAVSVVLHPAR